jgi:transcription elongation GreA/GreB family factor
MSRASVKETDDVPELPDRPVSEHPNVVTERGLKLIEAEVERYSEELGRERTAGDRERIAAAARELRYWTARRVSAELQPPPKDCEQVRFGCQVTIERNDGRSQVFRIVGEDEANPAEGTLSYVSPLARALLGREIGDSVRAGSGQAEIVAITA